MSYKIGGAAQKEDQVLGIISGAPARGKVTAVSKDGATITVERLGPAQTDPKSKQKLQGQIEHHAVPTSDFELIYRREVAS
jgi:ribosomal protein L24